MPAMALLQLELGMSQKGEVAKFPADLMSLVVLYYGLLSTSISKHFSLVC